MKRVCSLALFLSLLWSAPAKSQPPPDAPPLAYHQLHPDARKLVVDEIKIELQRYYLEQAGFWARILGGASAVAAIMLGIIGWRGLSSMRNSITSDLHNTIREDERFLKALQLTVDIAIQGSASAQFRRAESRYNLGRLEAAARRLDEGKGFTHAERDMTYELLSDVGSVPDVLKEAAFRDCLEKAADAFYNADVDQHLDGLDDQFRPVAFATPTITQTFMLAYGLRLIGEVHPSEKLKERFDFYVQACERNRRYEEALPYLLVRCHSEKDKGWERRVARLLKDVSYLSDDDLRIFFARIDLRAGRANDKKFVSGRQEAEAYKFAAFVNEYRNELGELRARLKDKAKSEDKAEA